MTIPKYNIHKRLRTDLNIIIDELTMKINPQMSLLERCIIDKKIISIIIKYLVENDDIPTKNPFQVLPILLRKNELQQMKHI